MAICIAEDIMLCYVFLLYLSIPTHMNKLNNTPTNFNQHKKEENTGNTLSEWELMHIYTIIRLPYLQGGSHTCLIKTSSKHLKVYCRWAGNPITRATGDTSTLFSYEFVK